VTATKDFRRKDRCTVPAIDFHCADADPKFTRRPNMKSDELTWP
jgi:hypothetical protein